MIWLLHILLLPRQQARLSTHRKTLKRETSCCRESEGWRGAISDDGEKAWASINPLMLSGFGCYKNKTQTKCRIGGKDTRGGGGRRGLCAKRVGSTLLFFVVTISIKSRLFWKTHPFFMNTALYLRTELTLWVDSQNGWWLERYYRDFFTYLFWIQALVFWARPSPCCYRKIP